MVMFNSIYFELKMVNFKWDQMNPNLENQYEIVFVQQIRQLIEGLWSSWVQKHDGMVIFEL